MRALSLPGCAARSAFQFAVMARLAAAGERFDLVAGASSGSLCGAAVVAGLAAEAPAIVRRFAATPIVSTRYWATERSIFGVGRILRDILERHLPEHLLRDTESELLVATTHAGRYARGLLPPQIFGARAAPGERGLVIHSNRERAALHEVILASCYIPLVNAGLARLDGEVHLDGAVADNTLLDALVHRGADEITVVTPFTNGAVARTMFTPEGPLHPHPHVRLRLVYPERPLSIGRFDLDPERIEEAMQMPHVVRVIEPEARPAPGGEERAVDG
jgi:predicted acylesterase/phospholipase RssA